MIRRFYKAVLKAYIKEVDGTGISIFRIAYSIVLLMEVLQIFYFRHLIFDYIPYLKPYEIDFTPALIAWMISLLFLALGLYTRIAALCNYIFSLVFLATISTYEYHMFYVYMGVNFLLLFVNVSQVNSLDRLLLKFKYSNTRFTYNPPVTVSVLNYYILILVAIAFVYFDSVFFKLSSYNWLNGLGMWLPASLPQITHFDTSLILNNKWLSLGLGYLTLLFETIFIFTFFRRRWRVWLMIVGIGLHIGIVVQFAIPWFGLGVTALYLLLVPAKWWRKFKDSLRFREPALTIYYDEECPLCNRTKIFLYYFDVCKALDFKGVQTYGFDDQRLVGIDRGELLDNIYSITKNGKTLKGVDTYAFALKRLPVFILPGLIISLPGVYQIAKYVYGVVARNRFVERCTEENCGYTPPSFPADVDQIKITHHHTVKDLKVHLIIAGLFILILLQINVTYNSKLIKEIKNITGISSLSAERSLVRMSANVTKISKALLGITSHAVFMDGHFEGYNHIIGVEAELPNSERIWLPIIDKQGHPDIYAYSFTFVKWTFRVNSPTINHENLVKGLRDFTTFWAINNDVPLDAVKYNVYVKSTAVPKKWQHDFLREQMSKPWTKAGIVYWKEGVFVSELPFIE